MAIIRSGATTDTLTIDPNSKAARVTAYQSNGVERDALPLGSYMLPINVRHTGAAAPPVVVWFMRNTGSAVAYIRHLRLVMGFDGGPVGQTPRYELVRFSGATGTSGGAALTPAKKRTAYPGSTIGDARFDINGAGVTIT